MLEPGMVFAGYRIERLLGSGGMGAVYMARHPRLPRWDALKVLDTTVFGGSEFARRFDREAEHVARLDHRNIVAIHDRGIEQNHPWLSMQYIDGQDLAKIIAQGRPSVARALHILGEAARGLDHAHRAGLLHRDVKPANILVAPAHDEDERVLVTDFGIARALDDSVSLTATGSVVATLAYAAPEQIQGGDIDHRADIYALGATLFEMLSGTPPYPRPTPLAVMHAHLAEPPPELSSLDPALSVFDGVIAKAMAKDPAERFHTCRELADAAAHAFGGVDTAPTVAVGAKPAPVSDRNAATLAVRPRQERTPRGRGESITWVAAGGVLVLVVVAAFFGLREIAADSDPPEAGSVAPVATRIPVQKGPSLNGDRDHPDFVEDMKVDEAGNVWLLYYDTGIVRKMPAGSAPDREVPDIGWAEAIAADGAGNLFVTSRPPSGNYSDDYPLVKVSALSRTPVPLPGGVVCGTCGIAATGAGDLYGWGAGDGMTKIAAGSNAVTVEPVPKEVRSDKFAVNSSGDAVMSDGSIDSSRTWRVPAGGATAVELNVPGCIVADVAISDPGDIYLSCENSAPGPCCTAASYTGVYWVRPGSTTAEPLPGLDITGVEQIAVSPSGDVYAYEHEQIGEFIFKLPAPK